MRHLLLSEERKGQCFELSSNELLHVVERAIAHHKSVRDLKSKLDTVRARLAALTPRERQVFELIVHGKTNKQAARAR